MNSVIRCFFLLVITIIFSGCSVGVSLLESAFKIFEHQKDVSTESKFQSVMEKTYYLRNPVFLYAYPDWSGGIHIGPSTCSMLPASVEDYLRDPTNWQYTDSNARNGLGPRRNCSKVIVDRVIPVGASVTVTKSTVKICLGSISSPYYIYGFVEGVFNKSGDLLLINLSDLFENLFFSDGAACIDENLLADPYLTIDSH